MKNEISVFAPNLIVNCVDGAEQDCFFGRLYHYYSEEPCKYYDIKDMLLNMELIFNEIQFPMASTESRSFFKTNRKPVEREKVKLMQDKQILNQKGNQATFIIRVQHRQNSTWQGEIIWTEENKKQHFRSALELIKLMDEALSGNVNKEKVGKASTNMEQSKAENKSLG